jgi:hypothetical protein
MWQLLAALYVRARPQHRSARKAKRSRSIANDSAAQVCFGDVNGLPRLFSTGMDGYIRTFSTEGYEMYSRSIRLARADFASAHASSRGCLWEPE